MTVQKNRSPKPRHLLPTPIWLPAPPKGQKYPSSSSPTPDAREALLRLLRCRVRGLRLQNAQQLQDCLFSELNSNKTIVFIDWELNEGVKCKSISETLF